MIKVRVPATSANMGPGFDSMGVALSLYLYVDMEEQGPGYEITGCPEEFANEDNLVVVGYKAAMTALHLPPLGLKIHIFSEIPVTRGLGSSASLLTAGVFGANYLHGNVLTYEEMLEILSNLDGHPDNVAPALYGGMTAGFIADYKPYVVRYQISDVYRFTAIIPDFMVATKEARKILPAQVDFKDAVFNLSRTAALCKALESGNFVVAGKAWADRLHEPYRRTLIQDFDWVEKTARGEGAIAFCISGSGPTMMTVSVADDFTYKLQRRINVVKPSWQVVGLRVDTSGACVISRE